MNSGFDSRLWILFLCFFIFNFIIWNRLPFPYQKKNRLPIPSTTEELCLGLGDFTRIYYYLYFSPRTLFFLLQIYLIHNCHNFTILLLSQENDTNNLKFNRELNKMRLYIVLVIKNLTHFIGKFLIYY
jgi:hypothetical protein